MNDKRGLKSPVEEGKLLGRINEEKKRIRSTFAFIKKNLRSIEELLESGITLKELNNILKEEGAGYKTHTTLHGAIKKARAGKNKKPTLATSKAIQNNEDRFINMEDKI